MNEPRRPRPRLAVVGAGHLGRIHAQIAARNEAFDLAVVIDPDRHARECVAQSTAAQPFADVASALGRFDVAIIATPTSLHHQIGMPLLQAGIPLLIEKPVAATADEAQQLVAAAERGKLVLQVGHVERFNPAYTSVANTLEGVRYIECRRLSGFPFRSTDIGVVLDLMIHDLDLVLAMVDAAVTDVRATGTSVMGGHEDMAETRIEFANGCVAQLTASRVSYQRQRTITIVTHDRFHALDLDAGRTTTITPSDRLQDGRFDVDSLEPQERERLKANFFQELLVKADHEHPPVNAIEDEQFDFAAALKGSRPPRVTGADGHATVALAETILERIEHSQRIDQAPQRMREVAASAAQSGTDHILRLPRRAGPHPGRQAG